MSLWIFSVSFVICRNCRFVLESFQAYTLSYFWSINLPEKLGLCIQSKCLHNGSPNHLNNSSNNINRLQYWKHQSFLLRFQRIRNQGYLSSCLHQWLCIHHASFSFTHHQRTYPSKEQLEGSLFRIWLDNYYLYFGRSARSFVYLWEDSLKA